MGRKRKTNHCLPNRMYFKMGKYRYLVPKDRLKEFNNKTWITFCNDLAESLKKYRKIVDNEVVLDSIDSLITKYKEEELEKKSPRTQKGQKQHFKNLSSVFGKLHPDEISISDVQKYCTIRGKSSVNQANQEISTLSTLFRWAKIWEVMTHENPCSYVIRHDIKPRTREVLDDELQIFLKHCTPLVLAFTQLKVLTGRRMSDILGIMTTDIDNDGIKFTEGKTRKRTLMEWLSQDELERGIKLEHSILKKTVDKLIALQKIPSLWLFCKRNGDKMAQRTFQDHFKNCMDKAIEADNKLIERFQDSDLRAYHAGVILDDGGNPQESLRHSTPKQTETYLRRRNRTIKIKPAFIPKIK